MLDFIINDVGGFLVTIAKNMGLFCSSAFGFFIDMITIIPKLLMTIFGNLPEVFQYGITGMFGIIVVFLSIKIIGLFVSFIK